MAFAGMVNTNARGRLVGWCVDLDNPMAPVQVDLYWGDRLIKRVATYGKFEGAKKAYGNPNAAFYFTFTRDLVARFPAGTQLRVTAPDGMELPLNKAGTFEPIGEAGDNGLVLTKMLDDGYVVDKWGALKLPFRAMDEMTRAAHATSLSNATTYFRDRFGITLFPHYGTLLGYARSGAFLPHDDDTDTSFVVEGSDVTTIANNFMDIAEAIHDDGLMVRMVSAGQFAFYFPGTQKIGTDVFCSWHRLEDGEFSTYFGVNGHIGQRLHFTEELFEGVRVSVPNSYKDILALTYGPNWIKPDPNFSWSRRISELDPVMAPLRDAARSRLDVLSARFLTRTSI